MKLWVIIILVVGAILGVLSWQRSVKEHQAQGRRIVSLSPATTEILFALGLGQEVVGVSAYSNYPPEANSIPQVGSYHDPSIEQILRLKPDLVIGQRIGPDKSSRLQKNLAAHCKLLLLKVDSLDEIIEATRQIAQVSDRAEQGRELVNKWRASIERLRQRYDRVPDEERVRVYVEIGANPLRTAGPGSYISELIRLAGGQNMGDSATGSLWPVVSSEVVIKWSPQVILLLGMTRSGDFGQEISSRLGWGEIEAVQNGRIIELSDAYKRQGPRLFAHAEELAKIIHGEHRGSKQQ